MLVLARVPETVAQEVHRAALPAATEDLGDRRLQPGVRIAEGELHADAMPPRASGPGLRRGGV